MDAHGARPRASRKTFSCTECRRRKQKCNQEQPCNNCRRRFPEPVCDYGFTRQEPGFPGYGGQPTFVLTPAAGRPLMPTYHVNHYPRRLPPSWSPAADRRRRPGPGLVVRWSGVNLTTEYPVCDDFDDDEWETVLPSASLPPPSSRLNISRSPRPSLSPSSPGRDLGASRAGSTDESQERSVVKPTDPPWRHQADQIGFLWQFAGPTDSMGNLPFKATKQNAVLAHTFSELLYHFKGSFDGVPDPDNPFVNHYVPWCLQSTLLAQTSLYISARSLAERGYIDQQLAMKLKGQAIHSLNEHLRSDAWIGDEAMAAVVQFISIEWFFGETEVVLAHLKGLREMVRLRGGFTTAGVGALVTKVALVDDCVIALSLDSPPVLQREPGINFQYAEPAPERFIIRHNSPLLPSWVTFESCAEILGLHLTTASILDDIRFLISATLELPADPPPEKTKKLQKTAQWIHDRICQLPLDVPGPAEERATVMPPPGLDMINSEAGSPEPHSLLPSYPKFTSNGSQGQNSSPSPAAPSPSNPSASRPAAAAAPIDPSLTAPTAKTSLTDPQRQKSAAPSASSQPTPQPARSSSSSPNNALAVAVATQTPAPDPLYTAVRLAAPMYARAIATRSSLLAACSPAEALQVLGATWRVPLARWRAVVGVFLFVLAPIIATVTKFGPGGSGAGQAVGSEAKGNKENRSGGEGVVDESTQGSRGADAGKENMGIETGAADSSPKGSPEASGDKGPATSASTAATTSVDVESLLAPHAGFVKSILQIGFMQIALEDWPVCADMMGRLLGVQRWLGGEAGGMVGTPPW